jgi:hypothetical protein
MGFSVGVRMGPVRVSNKGISAGVSAGPVSYSKFARWGGRPSSRSSTAGTWNADDTLIVLFSLAVVAVGAVCYGIYAGLHWLHLHHPVYVGMIYGALIAGALFTAMVWGITANDKRRARKPKVPTAAPKPKPKPADRTCRYCVKPGCDESRHTPRQR